MQKYNSRQEVPEEYKWDLTDIFKDVNEFEECFNDISKKVKELGKYSGCFNDVDRLAEFLIKDSETNSKLERLQVYAYVTNDQELGVSESIDRQSRVDDLTNEYHNQVSFFAPELMKLNQDEYDNLFKNETVLGYKAIFDDIYRSKEHIIDADKQQLINDVINAAPNYGNTSATLINSIHDYGTVVIDGEEEKITQTNLIRLYRNKDKKIREEVRRKFYSVIKQYSPINADLINSYTKTCNTSAKIHKFDSSWDEKLFYDKIPNEVYEALVSAVEENLDVYQKYFRFYKDELGLDKLDMCDLYLDLVETKAEYSIEEAQEMCLEAVKPLGEDYYNHFKKIFDNHYIDYAQYPGKCSGGYSIHGNDFDTRILMSYNYDLDSISTIAHEGGHNVHFQYVMANNPVQYRYNSNIVCEVASLTNECLLSNYLINNGKTKEEKLKGIENILNVITLNLYSAVRNGKLEQEFYEYSNQGNTITKDYLVDLTEKRYKLFFGDTVNKDEFSGYSWATISHYYCNFYQYPYALSVCSAVYVASEIIKGNKDMLEKYQKFLTIGCDKDILDIYKVLGIDLKDKTVYIKAIEYLDSMIDKYIEIKGD